MFVLCAAAILGWNIYTATSIKVWLQVEKGMNRDQVRLIMGGAPHETRPLYDSVHEEEYLQEFWNFTDGKVVVLFTVDGKAHSTTAYQQGFLTGLRERFRTATGW
jgi:hypothetical protein